MPRLLIFAPCEKVIIGNDNTISLLTIFEELQIGIPPSEEKKLPVNAQIPLKWFIFCLWHTDVGDEGITFEQSVKVSLPGNKTVDGEIVEVKFEKQHHRVITQLLGFPVCPAGTASITVSLRLPPSKDWKQYGEYPMQIQRPK